MRVLIRFLSACIDLVIVYIPARILLQVTFHQSSLLADLIAQVLFVLYCVIITQAMDGRTVGKMFGTAYVVYNRGERAISYSCIREIGKMLYFLPFVGSFFLLASMICYKITNGRMLHDVIGDTKVQFGYGQEKVA